MSTGEFQFDISPTQRPPRPWVNVIANASFGFQVSETGSGYTWAINSRQHQITPWSNDPVQDPGHEHYLLQDIETAQFLYLAKARGDMQRADTWLNARQGWIEALHTHGWDGEWFRRAFFDNDAPLGSSSNAECKIDLIAQAWSVLSCASTDTFMQSAMQSMTQQLINDDMGLSHLLAPPFEKSQNNPGYIQAYPTSVRENGDQYNHAAVWAMMSQAQTGDANAAWESFKAISPACQQTGRRLKSS